MSMSQFDIDALGAQIARSATPTSSAQVAEGMNLEAERAAPELLPCPFCGSESIHTHSGSYYAFCGDCGSEGPWNDESTEDAIAAWNRRTAAPVAEGVALPPLDVEGLPPLPRPDIPVGELILYPIDEPYYSKRTVEQVRNTVIAPYAERIRQLEREHGLLSMVVEQLKERLASADALIESMATKADRRAYIDGRTAGPAVPADPMDWPIPCDVTVGAGTIKKGCKLRTLVTRMESLHRMAVAAMPKLTPEQQEANWQELLAVAAPKPQEDA